MFILSMPKAFAASIKIHRIVLSFHHNLSLSTGIGGFISYFLKNSLHKKWVPDNEVCFFSIAWSWSHLSSSLSHSAALRRYYIKNDYSCDCGVCLQARNSRRRAAKEIEIYMSWSIIPMQRDILYILLNFFFFSLLIVSFPSQKQTFSIKSQRCRFNASPAIWSWQYRVLQLVTMDFSAEWFIPKVCRATRHAYRSIEAIKEQSNTSCHWGVVIRCQKKMWAFSFSLDILSNLLISMHFFTPITIGRWKHRIFQYNHPPATS